ncbi:AsnC family transcriptional regulator [Amylibacter marinus]|uniref:AsnC family transcriptional regulator n=1 Tax=Amylibacter marinus TaxID=1475483 RepID=A0ABQ5VQQ1_9RHOB|nr:winged helix-turn-helix transcriptional regulator [Amylibacter marinus]GLQ33725.1 AsnC family transcriptional regulator [Amylibacter marinus]
MGRDLDKIDLRILEELEANGRLSIVDLAARINLSNTPCSERVKRLERTGYIKKYKAILDMERLGRAHLTVVQVSLSANGATSLTEFNRAIKEIPEVESCLMVAASFDYLLTIRTRDMAHFREVLGEKLNNLPSILQTSSFAVMETVANEASYFSRS